MSSNHQHDDDDDLPRKHHDEHPHEEGEPWLVSYADLMTLLFGFFVLMYSFAASKNQNSVPDNPEMVAIRKELAQYFGGAYINPLEKMSEQLKQAIERISKDDPAMGAKLKNVAIDVAPEGLKVTFSSTVLFASGSSTFELDSQLLMREFVGIVKAAKQSFKIRVEGYTDPIPINSEKFPSNWELSGARASTVIRIFEESGFNSENLTAVGYGSTRPAVPNFDVNSKAIQENFAKNRRVVIFIMEDLTGARSSDPSSASASPREPVTDPAPSASSR